MSTEAIASPVTLDVQGDCDGDGRKMETSKPTGLHSPPDSNNAMVDGSDSELSDLDDMEAEQMERTVLFQPGPEPAPAPAPAPEPEPELEEDIGEVLPDHYSGTVPVFKPTMRQFKDFKLFMAKIDAYGMKSGIVKIIPPEEWKEAQPRLDGLVKQIRVRDPIKQEIMGSNGTYRQVNILHQRAYNLPQWRQLCDQSEHQPPARRGERRANADKPKSKPATRSRTATASGTAKSTSKSKRGRVTRRSAQVQEDTAQQEDRPMTPISPKPEDDEVVASVEQDPGVKEEDNEDDTPVIRRMGGIAKPKTQSTSARRKYIRREGSAMIDEAAFKDFDYLMDVSDYTPERCEELERTYWRTLTYAPPLYGADLPGTLFDESSELWNLNKLPNLLDVLGTKVPGVNTAYLYLGMWKATFAWHLEDVDLYSINYLHFGAPKQWYSISQGDARRFEAAMKNIWPTEAKSCDQFLRHKGFLISPAHLKQHYNITVNKCVSYPGEFVVTYPYGYHSGYNLGYNCAEAVNFALDSWLPMGKIAKRCQCAQAQDSVWVDVYEIERKLRGESTEIEVTEDEDDEEEDEEDDMGLPTPPSSHAVRVKAPNRKRKRVTGDKDGKKIKKIRIRARTRAEPPCCLCPNDIPGAEILSTDDGRKAHRMCALYVPETYIEMVGDEEIVANANGINKARLELKCLYCRSKKGACFQCSQKKCARSYHATCAAAAGVFVEDAEVPVFGEDGTEYKEQAFEFSCRFHRAKRDKKHDGDVLENNTRIRGASAALKKGDICQMQFYRGDIFAGVVVENRHDEQNLLLDIIPGGDRIEVDWKWLLLPDPSEFRLPKASANAIPMPTTRKAKDELNARRPVDELPRKDDTFVEGFTWAEFQAGDPIKNHAQVKVNFTREDQIWHYLGKTSTESKAQYTENAARQQHNPKSNFLDSIPKPVAPISMAPPPQPRRSHPAAHLSQLPTPNLLGPRSEKPYVYKPRKLAESTNDKMQFTAQRFMPKLPAGSALQYRPGHLPQECQQVVRQHPLGAKRSPPVAADPRFKDYPSSASFTLDRFAPVGGSNGFPQLPGLTSPPAHMKSGSHSQPLPRAWSSSTSEAYAMPMTSSVLKSPSPARPVSTYQKYSFFQVHHNRDSTRYRSPYATWGGFTNGYEGNFRKFMIKAQQTLAGKGSWKSIPTSPQPPAPSSQSAGGAYGSPRNNSPPHARPTLGPIPSRFAPEALNRASATLERARQHPGALFPAAAKAAGVDDAEELSSAPLHPAIRPQYGATWQQSYVSAQPGIGPHHAWQDFSREVEQQTSSLSIPTNAQPPAPMRTPSFAKQSHSPIPLPPYAQKSFGTPIAKSAGSLPTVGYPQASSTGVSHPTDKSRHKAGQPLVTTVSSAPSPLHQQAWGSAGASFESVDRGVTAPSPASTISQTATGTAHQQQFHAANPQAAPRASGYQNSQTQAPPTRLEELPDVPADSTALLEQMMANLRRASERDAGISQGFGGYGGYGGN